jgi:hypothetical protein
LRWVDRERPRQARVERALDTSGERGMLRHDRALHRVLPSRGVDVDVPISTCTTTTTCVAGRDVSAAGHRALTPPAVYIPGV